MQRTKQETVIEQCGRCRARLALRLPSLCAPASLWLCRKCDAVFVAAPQLRDGRPFIAGIRPGYFDDILREQSPNCGERNNQLQLELAGLQDCLSSVVREGSESRRHARHIVAKRVQAISLADDLRIVGPAYHAFTVNISTGGLAILQSHVPEHPYLAIDFSETTNALPPVLLKQLRVKQVGPAFEVAGEFLSRIER